MLSLTQDHHKPAPSSLQSSISKETEKETDHLNVKDSCYKAQVLHSTAEPLGSSLTASVNT